MHLHSWCCMHIYAQWRLSPGWLSVSVPLLMYAVISLTLILVGPPHLDSSFGGFGGSVPCFRAWEFGWKFKGFFICFECSITHIVIILNQPQMGNKSFLDRSSIANIMWLLGFQEPEANIFQSQDTCSKEKVLTRSSALAGLFKNISIHWPKSQL